MIMAALLLLTLLSLSNIILSLAIGINIDCGSTGSCMDSNGVRWVGDNGFVTTGTPMKIPDVVEKPINTLRYFPTGPKNCYTNIPVIKGRKTIVRTKFYYKNYDGNHLPPSFDVVYDGKHRRSVKIRESLPNEEEIIYFSEVIYAPANENTSVCLFRTSPSHNPFISSIEGFTYDDGMYDDLGHDEGLILRQRVTYGAKELVSYPLDPYDRLWFPIGSKENSTLTALKTTSPRIDITGSSNNPPEIVMSQALSGYDLIISELPLPSKGLPVYLALYFSEPQSLGQTHKRSFNVFLDKTQVSSGPIVPIFGESTQVVIRDIVATSRSQVTFQSTEDSNLPPIINALELYSISIGQDDGDKGGGGQSGVSNDEYYSEIFGYGGTSTRENNAVGGWANRFGRNKKNNKLPLGLGIPSAFVVLSFAAFCWRKRQNSKPQSNTAPTTSTGISPLVGQQLASDASHPGPDEPGVYDSIELIA